jgi:hypothetical protein
MDHADYNYQMDYAQLLRHIHNQHFGVEVVSWHFHLHTNCLAIACQIHQPDSK